jgi:hypothetical protein
MRREVLFMKSPKELLRGVSDWMMFIEELKLTKYEVFIILLSYTISLMALFFSILAFISLYCSGKLSMICPVIILGIVVDIFLFIKSFKLYEEIVASKKFK